MKNFSKQTTRFCIRQASLLIAVAALAQPVYANVAQIPLSLTEGVPPNMILTLDDSGSMAWAYSPDNISGLSATRRYKSADFNPMYYNPEVEYLLPFYVNSSNQTLRLSTSYTSAHQNGFKPQNNWTRNLSSNYRVTRVYNVANNGHTLAVNPVDDFNLSCTANTPSGSGTVQCTSGYFTANVNRTSNGCNATFNINGLSYNATSCSRSGNNSTASLDLRSRGVPAYYYVFDQTLSSSCTATSLTNDDCYRLVFVQPSEEENFAIWYSFYRIRGLATVSAANIAFNGLSPSVRLTWQDLLTCTTIGGGDTTRCGDNRLKPFDTEHKKELFNWMANTLTFSGGTPLRNALDRAGTYLSGGSSGSNAPWRNDPNSAFHQTNNPTLSCRASFHVLMTDGIWNGGGPSVGNYDNTARTLPDGKQYTPMAPFADSTSNTLADVAFKYWATDLSNLDNNVPTYMRYTSGVDGGYWDPRNNPANWQHMSNFIVGLGLSQSLTNTDIPWSGSTFSGTGYQNLLTGTAWPAVTSNSSNNVYDLWHAAINSRGEFFSADSPESLIQAFSDILERIMDRQSTASKPGTSSAVAEDTDGNPSFTRYFHQSSYDSSEGWTGDLTRTARTRFFNNTTGQWEYNEQQVWSAKSRLDSTSPASRNIKIASSSGSTNLQNFNWSNAGSASTIGTLANLLSRDPTKGDEVDNLGQARLNFLRGDRSLEGITFRERYSKLGDIFSSSPVVVSGARMLPSRANRIEGNTEYSQFRIDMASRRSQIYVGANDGMLHAFDTETGNETFAFIPTAVFPKLHKLTGDNYAHEFYVDGTPVVADVYDGTDWRTILVGTLRAGGKGMFALDITNPDNIKLLWEFGSESITDENAVKLGYTFPQPTVARLRSGQWAVITGNGYHAEGHEDGRAALFLIDAIDGTLIESLEVQGTTGVNNGLSTPRLADNNGDGFAEYAYAGDLQGNLWRFDLLGQNASSDRDPLVGSIYGDKNGTTANFKVSYGGAPMFTARSSIDNNPQPIMGQPSLVRHPTRVGYVVVFGTGKYFEIGDNVPVTSHAQSIYGIWDMKTKAESTSTDTIAKNKLQQQTFISNVTGTNPLDPNDSTAAKTLSNNAVSWFDDNGNVDQRGWYVDLQVGSQRHGEMVVESMVNLGRTLFIQSLIPNDDPCEPGNENWLYAIDPATGGRTRHFAFDYRHSVAGQPDIGVSGVRLDGEGGITASQAPSGEFTVHTGQDDVKVNPDPESLGRQTWRNVPIELPPIDEDTEDDDD